MAQVAAVQAAKAELRKKLRLALAAMTDQKRREESEILVRKVRYKCKVSVEVRSSLVHVLVNLTSGLPTASGHRGVPVMQENFHLPQYAHRGQHGEDT